MLIVEVIEMKMNQLLWIVLIDEHIYMVKGRLEGSLVAHTREKEGKVASLQKRHLFGDGHNSSLMTVANLMMLH